MRTIHELGRNELEKIVASIQGLLYLDLDNRGGEFWNPDKAWSGAEVCDSLAQMLGAYGLVPQQPLPAIPADGPKRYVLYDFDQQQLATTSVYDTADEAAGDAGPWDHVLVVALTVPQVVAGVSAEEEAACAAELETTEPGAYYLTIDGPTLRAQRQLLLRLRALGSDGIVPPPAPDDGELIEGLISLTDHLADQAHDEHGIDCLLDAGQEPCVCQQAGDFCSGVPGILAHVKDGRLVPGGKVERCDQCGRYPSDRAARQKLAALGIA